MCNLFLIDGSPNILSFSHEVKVNSGATTTLVCTVTGNPLPKKTAVNVTDDEGALLAFKSSDRFSRMYTREIRYEVNVTTSGNNFTCNLALSNGAVVQAVFIVDVYSK